MTRFKLILATAALWVAPAVAMAQVVVSDVARFYRVYDAAKGAPTAAALQRDYLDGGSKGLHDFIPYRIKSAENLEKQIAKRPDVFANARSCVAALAGLDQRTAQVLDRIKVLYPAATKPTVTIVIGAGNSGGTTSTEVGVILGLEVTCRNETQSQVPMADRLDYLLAHEVFHTQQRVFAGDTVLSLSLNEGVADFLTELTTGHTANDHLEQWTKGKEAAIFSRFRADMDKTDFSAWLYNGVGTKDAPGDLGYWVGYRIAKSFYDHAPDKAAAIARLLEETDAKSLLRDSKWQ